MRVGIGNEREPVKRRKAPIHGRIGGKPRFQCVNVGRKVFETLLDVIEPGFGAEHREMRRPDVRGNKQRLGAGLEGHVEEVLAVQPQNGPAVGMQVADGFEPLAQTLGALKIGKKDKVVHLPRPAVLFVNRTDFTRNNECNPTGGPGFLLEGGF